MPQSKYINIKRKYDRRKKKNLFGSFFYRINDNKLKRDEGRGAVGRWGGLGIKRCFKHKKRFPPFSKGGFVSVCMYVK